MRFTKSAAVAATAVLAVALAACGGGAPAGAPPGATESTYNPQPRDNIKDAGTLTDAFPEISSQFNTFQGDGTLFSRLVWNWYNPMVVTFSEKGDPLYNRDYLTEDPKEETVGGSTRITYTINPKATFNDGTPIDWTAFDAVWKTSNGTNPAYSVSSTDGYDRIASVTQGVDAKQVVVTFNGTNVWWPGLFNYVLHPKVVDPEVYNKGYLDEPHAEWGAGPYTVSSFDKQNRTLTFTKNPKWWGQPGKLDSRTIVAMDTQARLNAFKNGQIDVTIAPTAEQLNQVKGVPNTELRQGPGASSYLLQINARTPVFSDVAVRKAIVQGIDRAQLGKIVFQGLEYNEPVPGSLTLLPQQQGYQDNFSKVVQFDPAKAKADLDAAGWAPGPDGVRAKNGQKLEFAYVYNGDSATAKAVASAVTAMMKNIGVTANVRQLPSSDFSSVIAGKSFDMFSNGFAQSDPYGVAYFCQLWCQNSELNLSGSGNPELDAKVKAVAALPTQQEQIAKANEIELETFATYGLVPIYNGLNTAVTKVGLANYGPDYGGTSLYFNALPENVGWQK